MYIINYSNIEQSQYHMSLAIKDWWCVLSYAIKHIYVFREQSTSRAILKSPIYCLEII